MSPNLNGQNAVVPMSVALDLTLSHDARGLYVYLRACWAVGLEIPPEQIVDGGVAAIELRNAGLLNVKDGTVSLSRDGSRL